MKHYNNLYACLSDMEFAWTRALGCDGKYWCGNLTPETVLSLMGFCRFCEDIDWLYTGCTVEYINEEIRKINRPDVPLLKRLPEKTLPALLKVIYNYAEDILLASPEEWEQLATYLSRK